MQTFAFLKDGSIGSKSETGSLFAGRPTFHLVDKIWFFLHSIWRAAARGERPGALGQFQLSTIAGVDQTPLTFSFNAGEGYSQTGARGVWHRGGPSGLEKHQCTVQLTLSADGEPQIKPLLIFRGKGKRLPHDERQQYDHWVVVTFQTNAWCDEDVMMWWIDNLWKRPICPETQQPKLLILNVHKGQTTANFNRSLQGCKTTLFLLVAPA